MELLSEKPIICLSRAQLKIIYGAERLSKNPFRDLFARIPAGVRTTNLRIISNGDDFWIIKFDEAKKVEEIT